MSMWFKIERENLKVIYIGIAEQGINTTVAVHFKKANHPVTSLRFTGTELVRSD